MRLLPAVFALGLVLFVIGVRTGHIEIPQKAREAYGETIFGQIEQAVRRSRRESVPPPRSPGAPPQFEVRSEPLLGEQLRELLYAGQHTALEGRLRELRDAYESDASTEFQLDQAYLGLAGAEPRLREEIEAWVQQRPSSAEAQLARAALRVEAALARRKGQTAKEAGEATMQDFERLMQLAATDAEAVLATDPGHPVAWKALLRSEGGRHGSTGVLALRDRLNRDAARSYLAQRTLLHFLQPRWGGSYEAIALEATRAQAGLTQNPRLAVLLGVPYWAAGADLASADRAEEALPYFDKALTFGEDPRFLEDRARALMELSRFSAALADLRQEHARFPTDETRERLGRARERMRQRAYRLHGDGAHTAALQAYSAYLELWPDDSEVLFNQGKTFSALNRHAEALRSFRQVIEQDPVHFDATRHADMALARDKRWPEVLALWAAYLEQKPDHAEAHMERGGAYFHMGDMVQAYTSASRACELGLEVGCSWKARLRTHPAVQQSERASP